MELDPRELSTYEIYQKMVHSITPRPIAWVSTISNAGIDNLAPFSFFTGVGAKPPTILFCPANNHRGEPKDTLRNVSQTGEFVVNVVPMALAKQMNQSSAEYPADISEFNEVGLTALDSSLVAPKRVGESLVSMECTLFQILSLAAGPGGANIVIGRIVKWHIADHVLGEQGEMLPERLDTIGRIGGENYVRTRDRFPLPKPKRPNMPTEDSGMG